MNENNTNATSTEKKQDEKKPEISVWTLAMRDRDPWGPVCVGCSQWGCATKGCSEKCARAHLNLPPWG